MITKLCENDSNFNKKLVDKKLKKIELNNNLISDSSLNVMDNKSNFNLFKAINGTNYGELINKDMAVENDENNENVKFYYSMIKNKHYIIKVDSNILNENDVSIYLGFVKNKKYI